jgi:hypothetical protein
MDLTDPRWTHVEALFPGDRVRFTNLPGDEPVLERTVRKVRPPKEGESVWTIEFEEEA